MMFGFLMRDWICPRCKSKSKVHAAADVRGWKQCVKCDDRDKEIRRQNNNYITAESRRLQLCKEGDHKSKIIELVEKHCGSGKAMQVADILKEGE